MWIQLTMSHYISQFVPKLTSFGTDNSIKNDYLRTIQGKTPKLKYITIYNPSFIGGKGETNEELLEQVFCFITDNEKGDDIKSNQVEQIRIIGLIQAIEGLSDSFNEDNENNDNVDNIVNNDNNIDAKVVKANKSSIIVKRIEGDFRIACSISMPEDGIKRAAIDHQMVELINKSYKFFRLLNTSFSNIITEFNKGILKNLMKEHWLGFLRNYNSENFKFPPTVKWTNSLNYRGFLGMFNNVSNAKDKNKTDLYKRSSIELNYNMRYEIDHILNMEGSSTDKAPKGIILSYFNKAIPKKYGMIYFNNSYDEEINDNSILKNSLIDIYNYLEYYDYHEKLTTEKLTKLSNDDLFSSPDTMKDIINTELSDDYKSDPGVSGDPEEGFFRQSASMAVDLLNPINLTNNLVILPINYTMNSMMNLHLGGDSNFQSGSTSSQSHGNDTSEDSWFKLPSYLKFSNWSGTQESTSGNSNIQHNDDTALSGNEDEDQGNYVVGLLDSTESDSASIHRKLVYLDTKLPNGKSEEQEYLLVIYMKNDIYMVLIYKSSITVLDELNFYKELKRNILVPTINDLELIINGSTNNMESSISSLPTSVNGMIQNGEGTISDQLDSDFFFIVYDKTENVLKSSLPYLPLPINLQQLSQLNRASLNIRNVMFYLHDQLSDLFFLQETEFFHDNCINEYFHKFNTNHINDWMFYYLKFDENYIVIVKNVNANGSGGSNSTSSNKKKQKLINQLKASNLNSIIPDNDVKLEFLDNLGDDVKLWFENYMVNGAT